MPTRKLLALAILCGLAWSQTALTTIQDTLFTADGSRFNGTVTIQWSTFDATNIGMIVQQSKTVQVVNGNLYVQLVPNAGAQPPANVYTVQYQSGGSQQFTESWTVGVSAQPLTVAEVRIGSVTVSTSSASANAQTPIPESSVVGLVDDLTQRPMKGVAFGTNGVAIVDDSGALETAVGQVGDCVMVDGTTGPCGGIPPTFADNETPGGIVDGSNNTFTLVNIPSGTSLILFRNGLFMTAGSDYTLTASTLLFPPGTIPQPLDVLTAFYRVDPSVAGNIGAITGPASQVHPAAAAQVRCSEGGACSGGYNPREYFGEPWRLRCSHRRTSVGGSYRNPLYARAHGHCLGIRPAGELGEHRNSVAAWRNAGRSRRRTSRSGNHPKRRPGERGELGNNSRVSSRDRQLTISERTENRFSRRRFDTRQRHHHAHQLHGAPLPFPLGDAGSRGLNSCAAR